VTGRTIDAGIPDSIATRAVTLPAPRGSLNAGPATLSVAGKGELRLYVTGSTLLSTHAMENMERLLRDELAGEYAYEVIDVLERPDLAAQDRIFATPALVRRAPLPVRKLIGDLSDRDIVLSSLRLGGAPPSGAPSTDSGRGGPA
jgi:circadian clock protein KaiB